LAASGLTNGNASKEGTISKLFTQELVHIAQRDPLHDLTVQVKNREIGFSRVRT
jgi:hypothetical protein